MASGTPPFTHETRPAAPAAGASQPIPALPPEPRREDFQDEEEVLEALAGWRHRVGPVLRLARSATPPSKVSPDR